MPGFLEVFTFGGGDRVHLGGVEQSVEDHYLHINGIIFGGGVANSLGGDSPPPKKKPAFQEALGCDPDFRPLIQVNFVLDVRMGMPSAKSTESSCI